jgi:hypothetical protein
MSHTQQHIKISSWKHLGEGSRFEYRQGYKKAADLLADAITANVSDFHFTFGMIFPALFLYRHYIELEFKDLLALGQMFKFDGDASDAKPHRPRHDLEKMLKATVRLSKNAMTLPGNSNWGGTLAIEINFRSGCTRIECIPPVHLRFSQPFGVF